MHKIFHGALVLLMGTGLMLYSSVNQASETLPDEAVIVERGGVALTVGELRAKVRLSLPKQARVGFFSDGERVGRLVEDQLITRQLAALAKEAGLDKNPHIQAEMEAYIVGALARLQIDTYLDNLSFPDAELLAEERYRANKAEFVLPESRNARHILILVEEKTDEEALAKANQAWEALESGQSFDDVLTEYSEDPAISHNGWVRDITEGGAYDADFTAAAFALGTPGEYSKPVKTAFGYHIIQLQKITPAGQRSFDEVKETLIAGIRNEQRNSARDAYMDTLRTMELHINDETMKVLPTIEP